MISTAIAAGGLACLPWMVGEVKPNSPSTATAIVMSPEKLVSRAMNVTPPGRTFGSCANMLSIVPSPALLPGMPAASRLSSASVSQAAATREGVITHSLDDVDVRYLIPNASLHGERCDPR